MRIEDVAFTRSGALPPLTVVLAAPTNSASWLVRALVASGADVCHLDVLSRALPPVQSRSLVIVDGCELPLLAQQIDPDVLYEGVQRLRAKAERVVVCACVSAALISEASPNGRALNRFVKRLLYDAQLVLQLQPLRSGRAADVTGRLTIAAGAQRSDDVLVRDLSYFVDRRGTVDVFEV